MNAERMRPAEEFEFYSQPENLRPQGPARRRTPRLSDAAAVKPAAAKPEELAGCFD